MSFHYRHRKVILIVLVVLLFVSGGIIFYKVKLKNKNTVVSTKVVVNKKTSSNIVKEDSEKKSDEKLLKVDIKGEIINPGIYSLNEESRVIDVINSAGGLTENADTTVLNLSKKIKDEMVIIIYSKDEVSDFKKTKEVEQNVNAKCVQKDSNSLVNDACIDSFEDTSNIFININTASLEELKKLPGIGEGKASNIINYRNSNGGFKSIEELKNVDGIGDSLYAQIEMYITI